MGSKKNRRTKTGPYRDPQTEEWRKLHNEEHKILFLKLCITREIMKR